MPIGLTTFDSAWRVGAAIERGMARRVPGTCDHDVPAVLSDDVDEAGTKHRVLGALQGGETVTVSIERISGFTVTVQDRPRRRWERGVYTGDDSTNPASVARQQQLERRFT